MNLSPNPHEYAKKCCLKHTFLEFKLRTFRENAFSDVKLTMDRHLGLSIFSKPPDTGIH